jgi:membrane protein DedA with SNARE-associated domain
VPPALAAIVDVAHVGLPVLFLLIAIETMGVPVPGETALFTAGVLASRGKLSIEAVIAVSAAGAILGETWASRSAGATGAGC